jgi:hypothetical protein
VVGRPLMIVGLIFNKTEKPIDCKSLANRWASSNLNNFLVAATLLQIILA